MATVTESVEVSAPISMVYNAWTRFESFPEFMVAVQSVEQIDDVTNHWVAAIGGVEREFDTRITEQVPDEVIAWASTDGKSHTGRVRFESIEIAEPDPDLAGTDAAQAQPSVGGLTSGAPVAVVPPEQMGEAEPQAPRATEGTRVHVEFTWDDETFLEKAGEALGLDDLQVRRDLHGFKNFVENSEEVRGWRGEVHGGRPQPPTSSDE